MLSTKEKCYTKYIYVGIRSGFQINFKCCTGLCNDTNKEFVQVLKKIGTIAVDSIK